MNSSGLLWNTIDDLATTLREYLPTRYTVVWKTDRIAKNWGFTCLAQSLESLGKTTQKIFDTREALEEYLQEQKEYRESREDY